MQAVVIRCPQFLPYARLCYEKATPLFRSNGCIESQKETHQGDVCGPLFFAVTLQAVAAEAAQTPFTSLAAWYLDDGSEAVAIASLAAAEEKLEPAAAAVRLTLSRAKCKLWGSGSPLSPSEVSTPLRGIPWVCWTSGVKLLGTPNGRASCVRGELIAVHDMLQATLEKLNCLGGSQTASHILRSCLETSEVMHSALYRMSLLC